jgi:D-aminopeptidase
LTESGKAIYQLKVLMMSTRYRRILIIADIEGSSGCRDYRASSFLTREWAMACESMTRDIDSVVTALFDAGVEHIRVKDFHRTGFNLLPELMDSKAEIIHGYRKGPVPGIGGPEKAEAVMFLGMHAASGTDGFLAHTLTSRLERLEVNGKPLAEIELFASALAPFGVRPVFFTGCPVACEQARAAIPNIFTYSIHKKAGAAGFNVASWRAGLASAAVRSLENEHAMPYLPKGPFHVQIEMRGGDAAAQKIARRWNLNQQDRRLFFTAAESRELFMTLIRICYLSPGVEKMLPISLMAYNLWGHIGLAWVRRQIKKRSSSSRTGTLND